MSIFNSILAAFVGLMTPRRNVSNHHKLQAYGPRWSQHRRRRVNGYRRRQPRRR